MPSKIVRITCRASGHARVDALLELQGNIKTLTQENADKLEARIVEDGMNVPVFVWKDFDGALRIVDGHQRLKVLKRMEEKGWTVPEVPVSYIFAKDEEEAKKRLLSIMSQYGDIDAEGMRDFLQGADLTLLMPAMRIVGGDVLPLESLLYLENREPYDEREQVRRCPNCGFQGRAYLFRVVGEG